MGARIGDRGHLINVWPGSVLLREFVVWRCRLHESSSGCFLQPLRKHGTQMESLASLLARLAIGIVAPKTSMEQHVTQDDRAWSAGYKTATCAGRSSYPALPRQHAATAGYEHSKECSSIFVI